MKFLIILTLLFLPLDSVEADDYSLLTCEDYEFLMEGLDRSEMDERFRSEIKIEFINATEPACFDS